ncbi:F-actin-capping protein subunit alpha [Erysiphe necator]|nr:F-actin-capping protein subunit alpha [Erysiphe necator]
MASHVAAISAFVEGAPPGELANVITDIEALTIDNPSATSELGSAFRKYNEEQFATVKLPGSSNHVIVSSHNSLGDDRYYDVGSSSCFAFDHTTQKASNVQSYALESTNLDLIKSFLKNLAPYIEEHYPDASFGVYPIQDDTEIAIAIVANKYSPKNLWNGRWRSLYKFSPSSLTLNGYIKVDVHYYENGNVRLLTTKPISRSLSSSTGAAVVREISSLEKKYQEDLNESFYNLSEGAFKGLRRQLPVTRQKVEWDKIAGYRLGHDIGTGNNNR